MYGLAGLYGLSKSAKFRERDRWVHRGFPQCSEISKVRGNPSVRRLQQQDTKKALSVLSVLLVLLVLWCFGPFESFRS
jgi:hypothetical protein